MAPTAWRPLCPRDPVKKPTWSHNLCQDYPHLYARFAAGPIIYFIVHERKDGLIFLSIDSSAKKHQGLIISVVSCMCYCFRWPACACALRSVQNLFLLIPLYTSRNFYSLILLFFFLFFYFFYFFILIFSENGVKQGGIVSPVLFCVNLDELLQRLHESGVGCYIGSVFVGL